MSSQTRACGMLAGPLNLGIQDLLVVGGGPLWVLNLC